jgi:ParB-like chromosome segregation protein Spo0J
MDYQLPLITIDGVLRRKVQFDLDKIPADEKLLSKPASRELVEDIAIHGLINPVILAKLTDPGREGEVFVIAGTRRVKSARLLGWTTIEAVVGKMGLKEAMLARSAHNNMATSNDLADIAAINYLIAEMPGINVKDISRLTGINVGRVKSLYKEASLPPVLLQGALEGHVSEATLKNLSKQTTTSRNQAAAVFVERKEKMDKEVTEGKVYAEPKSLFTMDDVIELQRARVQETIATLMPELPVQIDLPLLDDAPKGIRGYIVVTLTGKVITTELLEGIPDLGTYVQDNPQEVLFACKVEEI